MVSTQHPKSRNRKSIFTTKRNKKWGKGKYSKYNSELFDTGDITFLNDDIIAFTKSGELLIGTDQGYVKMRSPNNAFTGGDYDAQSVIVSVDANSNLGGKLLETEVINCITIDGADIGGASGIDDLTITVNNTTYENQFEGRFYLYYELYNF